MPTPNLNYKENIEPPPVSSAAAPPRAKNAPDPEEIEGYSWTWEMD